MNPPISSLSLVPLESPPEAKKAPDPWAAQTELATRIVAHEDDEAPKDTENLDIGKAVGRGMWELFVSCAPADALALQFQMRSRPFMVVHDFTGQQSYRLLAQLAQAAQQVGHDCAVQRLVIRRQGFGNNLATLAYVEVPTEGGGMVRVYASHAQADAATRRQVQRVFLARAALCAVLACEATDAQAHAAFVQEMAESVREGRHAGRALVWVPLAASVAASSLVELLSEHSRMQVRRAPAVRQPIAAWSFLASTWRLLTGGQSGLRPGGAGAPAGAPQATTVTSSAETATAPTPMPAPRLSPTPAQPSIPLRAATPAPAAPASALAGGTHGASPAAAQAASWLEMAQAMAAHTRGGSVCVFRASSMQVLAHAGSPAPDASLLVRQGRILLSTAMGSARSLGLGSEVQGTELALPRHHLVLRPVPGHPDCWSLLLAVRGPGFDPVALRDQLQGVESGRGAQG